MQQTEFNESIGRRIRDLRKSKGLTQEQFATLSGFSRGTIANIETGRQAMSAHQVYHVATVLGLQSIGELFPELPLQEDEHVEEVKIHRAPDLSEDQLRQVRALASKVR
ncbi:helix-turn-helix domain-containing protein [Hyphomonas sp. CY54-11-8]|uniref:helix-turn-helix domain-containing protein n=1 Tax=Hyphomonas sp. CY54-11-8 TaxID=1280944 RepID=UPI00045904DF|nr:helix-turn-helix transcriptional regulator [Hyphomonas sp. CY54-11-8]KCZ48440.1 Cro/Cl family transcriptional regulator [Hyphomonas sp. CY54-11-8]